MAINFECLPENYSSSFYRELFSRFPETFIVAEADDEVQGYIMCRVERGFSKLRNLSPARLCTSSPSPHASSIGAAVSLRY